MGNPYLASIIITSYNYGRFLPEAIDSALGQTYPNTEVIVVDDGSTDNSREIISDYGDRVVSILKENGGQASAFNVGFLASRGDVILFLDSDDMLAPVALETAMDYFQDPDVAKVHWPLWLVDKNGKKTGDVGRPDLPEGDLREIVIQSTPLNYAWPPTSGNAWSRRFIERIFPMPEEVYRTWPDLYLGALAPLFGLVRRISQPQSFWRRHGMNNLGRGTLEEKLRIGLWREECCMEALSKYCKEAGLRVDMELWKANSWWHHINWVIDRITPLIPPGTPFILVDNGELGAGDEIAGRHTIPFLEKDGQYWGPPPDDHTAIQELERLRRAGASFMVFLWPFLWWLDSYSGLNNYLHSKFHCVLKNSRLFLFDLR